MADQLTASRTGSGAGGRQQHSSRVAPRTVLLVASFGAFLAFLDATVVNVAFPSIRSSFPDASIGGLSWVLNAYNIVFASFLVIFGRLADLLGRRRIFAGGVAVFTVASLLCAIAPGLEWLVAFRVVQAAGAAMLVPASLAIVIESFPAEHRSHAVGLWGATAAVAAGLGPPIGGALVEVGDWRWAFLVNLPFGAVAWVLTRRLVVESRAPGRRRMPDLRGAVLLAAALSVLTLGIVQGNDWGWTSVAVLGSFLAAVLLTAGFVASSRAHPQPMLDHDLLRIRPFTVANLVTIVAGMGFYAYMLTNILWLQYVWGYRILDAGLALVPGAVVAAAVAGRLGPVAQAHGFRRIIVPGSFIWAGAYLWYALMVGTHPAFWAEWLPGQVLSGIGVGASLPLLTSAALAVVPGGRFGTASAITSSTRQLGGVLGIALLVVIIGTPTPANAADVLRDGWLFCAGCFAVAGVGALFLGRIDSAHGAAGLVPDSSPADLHVPERAEAPEVPESGNRASYLDRLPPDVRKALLTGGRRQVLPAGSYLFREGDPAAEMYVVTSGRLTVERHDRVIRELGAGAIIGELALLTGGLRSASARAHRDSELLAIDRTDFTRALVEEPATGMAIATALAAQMQAPAAVDRGSSQPVVVSVVGLSDAAPVAEVAAALEREIRPLRSIVALGQVSPDGLARAEHEHDRVLLQAAFGSPSWDFCLRQGDAVVVVATPDDEPPAAWSDPAQPELVLVGRPPSEPELARWSDALHPWQVTLVDPGDLPGGLRPLARRLAGRALGVVLAGGGARALTHIGVLQELEDAGVVVDRIAGCSLGALVASFYATGIDAVELEDRLYLELVRRKPFGDFGVPVTSLAHGRRANEALRRQLGERTRVEGLPRLFRCVSTDLLARRAETHRSGLLWEAVAASLRLPVLFPPLRAGNRLLVDGGVLDNLPVGLLTERDEGPLLAVNVGLGGNGRPRDDRPPRMPVLGETLLRTMMIGSAGAVERARAAGAYVISPPSMGVGMLEFHQIDTMIEAGRAATRTLLETTGGDLAQ
ncbi:MAG TPA: MFS transporter [Marmoricola sp.]|nr:MFS transporter [Marmoricola sp.]